MTGYCCDKAQLQFDWKLGTMPGTEERIMAITHLTCLNCGADYAFDTKARTACPVVHEHSDDNEIVLRVRQLQERKQ